jgi:hypothetical protein
MLVPKVNRLHSECVSYVVNAESTCNTVLKAYRDLNRQIRTGQPPAYFGGRHSFGDPRAGIPAVDHIARESSRYEQMQRALLEKAASVRTQLQRLLERRQASLPSYFSAIDTSANQTLAGDARVGN